MAQTQADLAQIAAALNKLSSRARKALESALGTGAVRIEITPEVLDVWLATIETFGEASAAMGADQFERAAAELGLRRPVTRLAPGADPQRAVARARWALSQADQWGNLGPLLDELVKQPYRSTVANSAFASGAGYARVPSGKTCDFCLMLASRGGVYKTAKTAGEGKKFHGDCDCRIVLVRGLEDYPPGYDPDQLYHEWQARKADSELAKRQDET